MIIEVTGTNTQNKGAELMLVAIRDHFARAENVRLAVDQFFGSYADRARYGLLQKVALNGIGRSRLAVELMPREFRRAFGLVRDAEVDVLLDAAGFAFGDQHPAERTIEFAERVEAAKSAGMKVIMLPQALGPFERPALREAFKRIVDAADLVFARDDISLQHVQVAAGDRQNVRKAPDFTNLVKPELRTTSDASDQVCIVPNSRMIEKAESSAEADLYVPLIGECIEAVEKTGLRPVLLLHGADDAEIAFEIQKHVGRNIPMHEEDDPVALKRFLGESHLVIGSRFHALVGALSQGVPTIGTSWSHKYEMLFAEYDCADMLLPVDAGADAVRASIETATAGERAELTNRIRTRGEAMIEETARMWGLVDDVVGVSWSVAKSAS